MPTTTITLAFEVSYDAEHETEQGAREDMFRILEEAEQAGFFERQTIEATYAEVTTAPSLREMRKEMLAEGTEFSVCAACGAEIIRHPDGPWYHWTTGTEGYVDDPTGTDAMHKVVLAADNPDSVKSTQSGEDGTDSVAEPDLLSDADLAAASDRGWDRTILSYPPYRHAYLKSPEDRTPREQEMAEEYAGALERTNPGSIERTT